MQSEAEDLQVRKLKKKKDLSTKKVLIQRDTPDRKGVMFDIFLIVHKSSDKTKKIAFMYPKCALIFSVIDFHMSHTISLDDMFLH